MALCLPPKTVEGLLEAFRKGDLSLDDLQNPTLTSEGRHQMFANHFPKGQEELVTWMNGKFEEALLSNKKDAITSWLKKTFKPQDKKTYLDVMQKINRLDKMDALDPNSEYGFMEDLVATKLGIRVKADEVAEIVGRSKKLDGLSATLTPNGRFSKDYWKELSAFNDYVDSLNPTHKLRVFTSVIGRATMLLSVKSPMTNIISNVVQGGVEALNRRISSGQFKSMNNDFWKNYIKEGMEIYNSSGYDISRIDDLWMGQKRLGEDIVHSQGTGKTRAVGRWMEDVVFDKLMGTPDALTAQLSFADAANVAITKQVTQVEKLTGEAAKARHLELSKEVAHTDISNASDLAKEIRAKAIADARVATWTQGKPGDKDYTALALAIRKGLNYFSKDLRIGDQLMPFVKTPANVASIGIDTAGVGLLKGIYKGIQSIRKNDPVLRQEAIRDAVRAGTGLALAAALVYMVRPEDSTGTFESYGTDQKARDIIKAQNAPYNAIKINGKWLSYDYFGPIGPAMSGIMAWRKENEEGGSEGGWKYAQAVASQVTKVPGVQEISDLAGGWSDASTKDLGTVAGEALNTAGSFIKSRTIPGILGDVASMTDPYQREVGTSAVNQTMAAIPGLRQMLPEKVNQLTGEEMPNENPLSTLLFGRRVTTPTDSAVLDEIERLKITDKAPAMQDILKSSPAVKAMKAQLDDKEYQEALQFYGSTYGQEATKLIQSSEYQRMTDAKKSAALGKIREDIMENMVLKYSKNLTPVQQTRVLRKKASALLSISYDTIPDQIWGPIEKQYPGLRTEAERQTKLADSGTVAEKAYAKRWFQKYPMALKARQDIAQAKINMRKKYPEVGAAYDLIYK